jgi:tetratricopeptide (TPR) repeat protein
LLVLFGIIGPRSGWRWPVAGFLVGLRALATTNILATVPVFWIWILIGERGRNRMSGRSALALVLFTVGIAVAVLPVTYRNRALHGEFVLVSSNAGINFYLGNSGDYDAKVAIRDGADWEAFVNQHVHEGGRVGPEMSGHFFEKAREYIRSNPLGYARLLAYKTYLFVRGDEIMRNQAIYPFRGYSAVLRSLMWKLDLPGKAGLASPFGVLLPLAVPGCLLAIRTRQREGLLLFFFGMVYSLSVIAFFITARYRLPVVMPAILLLAYGWAGVRRWWSDRPLRGTALACMVVVFVMSNWNTGSMPKEMNPDAYYNLGNTLVHQGDIEGAEQAYRKALELNPEDIAAWVNLGLNVYQQRGDLDRAAACYKQALEVQPTYATAVFNLGFVAELYGRPAVAESLYIEAARLDPLITGPYINLASMALSRKDFEEARGYYGLAYRSDPEDPAALVGLGVTTSELQGLGPALVFFEEAIRIDPEFPDVYFNLSLAYARAGDPRKAAEYARKTLELDPADNDAYLIYADMMRSAGRAEEGRAFLEAAARHHPDLPGPIEALRRLGD